MNEAALGVHASGSKPAVTRPEPSEPIADDSGGGLDVSGAGVTLPTLLAVARLTPPQAAQLVADLVGQVELAGTRRGRPVTLQDDAVMVSDGGRLTIDGVTSRIEVDDAIVGLIRSIATNCRGSGFGDLLSESVSGATDPEGLIRRVRRVIDPELDPVGESRRRRQIGELVRATTGRSRPGSRAVDDREASTDVPDGPSVPAGSLVTSTGWYPPVRSPWHSRRRRPSRRQSLYVVLALVVLAGSAAAAPRAWDQLSRGWDALVHPVNTSSAQNRIEPVSPPPPAPADPAAGGGVAPALVDMGAPPAAGQITRVTASFADGSCSPGKPCAVRVDVGLDPSTVGAVTWKLNVYDRCTGEVREGGDVTIPAEPGRDGVYGLSRTTLPDASALGIAAVTSAPAVAASEPLYVPAENAVCR
ncbi:hypothetical protein DEU38_10140 [Rhodococcus sp. AG1013]|uniref:hypothetical protein n=1 Tax=Rhodococcus sp. AG1013 TaxID=2183996 RepID=UPI000E0B5235|nr:hypothetical protein [Rhodococcus sp. AG1013]RDI35563.1 hypothetical protein DEU38_10140 [Rhodococcus sp. AG1013]